jgi:hypothetical protein
MTRILATAAILVGLSFSAILVGLSFWISPPAHSEPQRNLVSDNGDALSRHRVERRQMHDLIHAAKHRRRAKETSPASAQHHPPLANVISRSEI